jgi:hypothetical protein
MVLEPESPESGSHIHSVSGEGIMATAQHGGWNHIIGTTTHCHGN